MKFGLFYELQLPFPHDDADVTRMFRETLDHVELAEQLGFHCIWGVEHHFLDDHALSSTPEVWLAATATRTSRIRIGHGIACVPPQFVHPARLAERIGMLDQISQGRVEFGTGESSYSDSRSSKASASIPPRSTRPTSRCSSRSRT